MDTREPPAVNIGGGHGLLPMNAWMEKARAVCYIQAIVENPRKNRDQLRYGSGFYSRVLINWDYYYGIFTNNHILSKEADARWAEAVFGYDNINEGKRVCLRPDLIFRTNEDLDYTFVGVQKEEIDSLQLGVIITPIPFLPEPRISLGDEIFIPQHPKGRPKEFSHGKIRATNLPFVYYEAETEKGSSGAPVFWRLNLVAVHQEDRKGQKYNKGALCREILSHLNEGTYTRPNPFNSIEDSRGKEIDQDCGIPKKEERTRRNTSLSPSERELDELAMEIIAIWKPLGRQLEVGNSKIEEILRDNIHYPERREKAFQMLLSWKESSQNPSYDALGNALIQLGKRSLAKHYCHM